jgi:hypothetical protein
MHNMHGMTAEGHRTTADAVPHPPTRRWCEGCQQRFNLHVRHCPGSLPWLGDAHGQCVLVVRRGA